MVGTLTPLYLLVWSFLQVSCELALCGDSPLAGGNPTIRVSTMAGTGGDGVTAELMQLLFQELKIKTKKQMNSKQ